MSHSPKTPVQKQTEPTEPQTIRQIPGEKDALNESDLDAVVGGAMRRGPGTQTEDDIYVG